MNSCLMHDFEIGFYLYSKLDFLIFHFSKKGLNFSPTFSYLSFPDTPYRSRRQGVCFCAQAHNLHQHLKQCMWQYILCFKHIKYILSTHCFRERFIKNQKMKKASIVSIINHHHHHHRHHHPHHHHHQPQARPAKSSAAEEMENFVT